MTRDASNGVVEPRRLSSGHFVSYIVDAMRISAIQTAADRVLGVTEAPLHRMHL